MMGLKNPLKPFVKATEAFFNAIFDDSDDEDDAAQKQAAVS